MGEKTHEERLAAARHNADTARKDFDAALAALESTPRGARDAHARVNNAAVALGVAEADLREAECEAGLRPATPPARGGKLIVALVRVPERAADALRYGPGDFAGWIAGALAIQYGSDFDADAGAPGNPWAVEVRARYGAGPEDADAFRGMRAAVIDPTGETARAVAAALDRLGAE